MSTGAHEYGHLILNSAYSWDFSTVHKNTSTRYQNIKKDTSPPIPRPSYADKNCEIDLMLYYADKKVDSGGKEIYEANDFKEKDIPLQKAANDDVRGGIFVAALKAQLK